MTEKMSRYESKLGPIPESHFENDCEHNPELMALRAGPESLKRMDEEVAKQVERIKRKREAEAAKPNDADPT